MLIKLLKSTYIILLGGSRQSVAPVSFGISWEDVPSSLFPKPEYLITPEAKRLFVVKAVFTALFVQG